LRGQMCQPRWWGESEQMHVVLRPAGDQMFDTRAWRGPAVVSFGTKRRCQGSLTMSAPQGETDVPREPGHFHF
jgi:hypothetical protein